MQPVLRLSEIGSSDHDTLRRLLTDRSRILLELSISGAQSPSDVAQQYLEVLFIGEAIVPYCHSIDAREIIDPGQGSRALVQFELHLQSSEALARRLSELARAHETPDIDHYEDLQEYERRLHRNNAITPFGVIADRYMAYFLAGLNETDSRTWARTFSRHPEYRFEYWKSYAGRNGAYRFYVSEDGWIIPKDQDMVTVIREYASDDRRVPSFEAAKLVLASGFPPIIISESHMATFPLQSLTKANCCAREILEFRSDPVIEAINFAPDEGIVRITDSIAHYLFFPIDSQPIPRKDAEDLNRTVDGLLSHLRA